VISLFLNKDKNSNKKLENEFIVRTTWSEFKKRKIHKHIKMSLIIYCQDRNLKLN